MEINKNAEEDFYNGCTGINISWFDFIFSKEHFLLWLFHLNPTHSLILNYYLSEKKQIIFSPYCLSGLSVSHSHWSIECLNSRDSKHHDIDPIKCHLKRKYNFKRWQCVFKTHGISSTNTDIPKKKKRKCIFPCNNLTHLMHLWLAYL